MWVTSRTGSVGFEKSQLVEIETWVGPDEFVRYGRRASLGGGQMEKSV